MQTMIGSYFVVSDLARSVQFYTRLFCEEPTSLSNRFAEWKWAGGHAFFGILCDPKSFPKSTCDFSHPHSQASGAWEDLMLTEGHIRGAVLNIYAPDIWKEYKKCQNLVDIYNGTMLSSPEPEPLATNYVCFNFLDPDNNLIEVFHESNDETNILDQFALDANTSLNTIARLRPQHCALNLSPDDLSKPRAIRSKNHH